jgi:hypothetical protein
LPDLGNVDFSVSVEADAAPLDQAGRPAHSYDVYVCISPTSSDYISVQNAGPVATSTPFNLLLGLYTNDYKYVAGCGDLVYGQALPAGKFVNWQQQYCCTLQDVAPDVTNLRRIGVFVDSKQVISESDETNNQAFTDPFELTTAR